ncbi:PREDICTED: NADH dehydrogenase [ubiquinone] 1 beta subcomplex subunit 3 isoform X2 [Cercocebus atys]|uniref:NADH dehydrogenase [ubiquinone] 1 beta subcomplex subunit 3 isoform X2 n=1 Tax=Cercocebus atys TaxID=9531 RepID=UPI0005F4AAAC|nr:PREDICTED: NADH dehydrogenase [ubiquinone] 1 beta subcomplex subunit 3 isoform X2 [Cercocebus atys]
MEDRRDTIRRYPEEAGCKRAKGSMGPYNVERKWWTSLPYSQLAENICNEAWRYMGGFAKSVSFFDVFFKGFKWGFAAFVVAVGAEYYLNSLNKDKKHH